MREVVWRIRLEVEGHEPGLPVWTSNEADARKAEAAGYTIKKFVSDEYDPEKLAELLDDLDKRGLLGRTGYAASDIDDILASLDEIPDSGEKK